MNCPYCNQKMTTYPASNVVSYLCRNADCKHLAPGFSNYHCIIDNDGAFIMANIILQINGRFYHLSLNIKDGASWFDLLAPSIREDGMYVTDRPLDLNWCPKFDYEDPLGSAIKIANRLLALKAFY
jgi:hypothetical protein